MKIGANTWAKFDCGSYKGSQCSDDKCASCTGEVDFSSQRECRPTGLGSTYYVKGLYVFKQRQSNIFGFVMTNLLRWCSAAVVSRLRTLVPLSSSIVPIPFLASTRPWIAPLLWSQSQEIQPTSASWLWEPTDTASTHAMVMFPHSFLAVILIATIAIHKLSNVWRATEESWLLAASVLPLVSSFLLPPLSSCWFLLCWCYKQSQWTGWLTLSWLGLFAVHRPSEESDIQETSGYLGL